jgi:hypothetical protein
MQPEQSTEPQPAASNPATRQILVVAGSGRSGTSLFTGLTGRLGMHIPKPEVKANRSNTRGFGEPRWAVDFHNELLDSVDVTVEDGRPEAWDLTGKVAQRPEAVERLTQWLSGQLEESGRIVVKDPRLAWFFELYRVAARELGADLRVATMLRHPAEVMRSREIAYGTKTSNATRTIGWVNMMLGIEARTRDLPRATVRYDDLLTDWRTALQQADESIGLELLNDPDRVAEAGGLIDPSLRRSVAAWDELGLPPTVLSLASRVYDTYGRLVGVPAGEQQDVRAELDDLGAEFEAYFDECFDVARSRTGANVRRERRRAIRRVREEMSSAPRPGDSSPLSAVRRRVGSIVRRSGEA